ncbi:MAG TPA: four-carbon acid sugar kinase family protein [Herpetosiphonaceae bacterium]|nr:four-carbon acid sugar kinase family protein [Herpetosiphonaceae bacterium]
MIGVIADDITGANDIGSMFAKADHPTHIYMYASGGSFDLSAAERPDVLILDTDSRFDPAERAYEKVFSAAHTLQVAGCTRYYKKICSVFRGNIGAELDALLDGLGERFVLIVAGFPKTGRLTIEGIHYVHGQKLEDSDFRRDPVHPMTRSNLVEILQSQTHRTVRHLSYRDIARGPDALQASIEARKPDTNYLLLDVAGQEALATIAIAAQSERVIVGSSGLAEELAQLWSEQRSHAPPVHFPPRLHLGVLCVAGSVTPQTAAQVAHLRAQGTPVFELDTFRLFDPHERAAEIERLLELIAPRLRLGDDVVLSSASRADVAEQTQEIGMTRGFTPVAIARLVSETIAKLVAAVVDRTGQNRLLVAGGDTAAAICSALSIRGMRVWKEIEPGVASCVSLSAPPVVLVLKAGGYGTADFFERAIRHLHTTGDGDISSPPALRRA